MFIFYIKFIKVLCNLILNIKSSILLACRAISSTLFRLNLSSQLMLINSPNFSFYDFSLSNGQKCINVHNFWWGRLNGFFCCTGCKCNENASLCSWTFSSLKKILLWGNAGISLYKTQEGNLPQRRVIALGKSFIV